MKVRDLMTSEVKTCSVDTPVIEAARIMSRVNCGGVPILSGQKLAGILTDRDIVLRAVAHGKDVNTYPCSECMTKSPITCSPDTDAHEASDLMSSKQIRRLPVVEGDRLVGMLALGDLATEQIHVNEAGEALSSISEPAQPGAH